MNDNRSNKAHKNTERPARVPLSAGNKLQVPVHLKKEGYFYYWALDRKGMIQQMEAAWYEKVLDGGKEVTVPAGGGETHYLMCIEEKYHNEDMAKQQKLNQDATTKQAHTLGEEEYVPDGSQNVMQRERDIV